MVPDKSLRKCSLNEADVVEQTEGSSRLQPWIVTPADDGETEEKGRERADLERRRVCH